MCQFSGALVRKGVPIAGGAWGIPTGSSATGETITSGDDSEMDAGKTSAFDDARPIIHTLHLIGAILPLSDSQPIGVHKRLIECTLK
jgi:hypothetical protein